jgi:sigma-B regulation protein RsbU (phosphoserine phosphatase)
MIVGDVSGKGIPASFYMTLTKGFIQSHMNESTSPKEVLIKVNKLMAETIDRKSFVTMFIAILDWESGKITCARAGHNPAIYYSNQSGECHSIKPCGIALGWREAEVFSKNIREHQIQMHDNDWFIMYTDGFIETQNTENKQFGEDGLIEILKENQQKNAHQMVETIFDRVMYFSQSSNQHDDMTIIGVKALPGSREAK